MSAPLRDERLSKPFAAAWTLLAVLALGTGVVALRYGLPEVPFPAPLPNFTVRHNWLIAHAVFSAIALLAGPWQFLPSIRRRALAVHRWVGRIYCGTVLAGWITSVPIAANAQTGPIASAGFLTLGACWITTTAIAYRAIRRRQLREHRAWMIRSYALTAAAITLRQYLPVSLLTHVPFETSYPAIAWLCWIPNLLFAEWLIRRSPQSSQQPTILLPTGTRG
jgi:uncharacterized membrane protein YozB (DUF420 family)